MDTAKIFYSWQSDLSNNTNRGFIQDVLEKIAKELRSDDSIIVEPVIDRDTSGVPGSPDIAATIFSKIDEAAMVVCDVTIIQESESRSFPNPNVLIELGYAVRSLGWDRVILVQNVAHGPISSLPFDLRQRRVEQYELKTDANQEEKIAQRKVLLSKLKSGAARRTSSEKLARECIELFVHLLSYRQP